MISLTICRSATLWNRVERVVRTTSPSRKSRRYPRFNWPGDYRMVLAGLLATVFAGTVFAQPSAPADLPIPETFAQIAPLFQRHCNACHGPEKVEGELRIDRLNPDLTNGPDRDRWREVLDRLNLGDMPPEKATPLPDADRERLTNWLLREMKRAELARNPATHFRRLTRLEYERTMQDLLGLPLEFASRLPEDGRAKSGFRNDGEMLRMSPLQFELYFQIAEEALERVIVEGPPPAAHRYRLAPAEKQGAVDVTVLPRPTGQPSESFAYFTKPDQQGPAFRIWNMSPVNRDKKKEAAAKEAAAKAAAAKEAAAK